MDASLADMRRETTEKALEFLKTSKKIKNFADFVKGSELKPKAKGNLLKAGCTKYAELHKGNFGELFIAELDLVYWTKLAEEL